MRTIVNISVICFLKVFLNLAKTLQKQKFVGRSQAFFKAPIIISQSKGIGTGTYVLDKTL